LFTPPAIYRQTTGTSGLCQRECGRLCNTDGRLGRVVKVIISGKRELSMAKTAASKLFTRSENVLA
jgi:hypothetical protein